MEKTADILFEYLKDIIYHPNKAHLDISTLPDEFKPFGKAMEFLAKCAAEERNFVEAISNGYISVEAPGDENVLALPLKDLQSMLLHMTWQTQQVAKGDYTQRIQSDSEFACAFNEMVEQLEKSTNELIAEKVLTEQKNAELQRNAKFMQILANDTNNMIFAFQRDSGNQLFTNKSAKQMINENPFLARMLKSKLINHKMTFSTDSESWEIQLSQSRNQEPLFYVVESFCAFQEEEMLVIHIVTDDTGRKRNEGLNQTCPLTGLHNKAYAMDVMERYMKHSEPFLLSFVDVDYLKYCNDTFGHESGDEYLLKISEMLKALECDVCRIGGDEFLLVKQGDTKESFDKKLFNIRRSLTASTAEPYPMSFSFGTCEITANTDKTLNDYLKLADDIMYEFKLQNKKPLEDLKYKDDRI